MKNRLLTITAFLISLTNILAQGNEPVLMTVGNEKITKAEFISAYQKNSNLSEATEQDLREYLKLYSEYKMKVQEAKDLKLDTAQAFQSIVGRDLRASSLSRTCIAHFSSYRS